ncbi:MAG TPA: HAMP domain-containing sensor histidine kinase [Candidatus Thermoplasmatota archaeon]|nr:HAMP domain-containing sensor histidine kinase [Candidatus Thermoplasmatota archaeon]
MSEDHRAQHAAAARALGFGRLFDAARDSVIVADERGNIVLWNESAAALFGWTAAEAVGQSVAMIVPERLRSRHIAGMDRFARTGRGPLVDARQTVELPAVRRDGSELVVELTLTPLEEPRRLVMAIVRDVTDRARLRESLEQERDRLREANEALEAFNFLVSHDLKEPVRALHGYLKLAQSGEADPRVRHAIARAAEANDQLEALLRGLLEWSRVARRPLAPVPLDIAEVAQGQEAQAQYANLLKERRAVLEVETAGLRALATAPLLAQVLGNAVVNAIKHNEAPAPRVRIVARHAEPGVVEVAVEDNGAGFPPAVLDWFHPSRRQELPTIKGGFGLLIARRAAERLGTTLELANLPGGGARVALRLPHSP